MRATGGFTLIELLVVISIISLLASLAVSTFSEVRLEARDVRRLRDLAEFEKGLALYYETYDAYPCGDNRSNVPPLANFYTWDSSGSSEFLDGGNLPECASAGLYTAGFYPIDSPKDPRNLPPQQIYVYLLTQDRQTYLLLAHLENDPDLMLNDGGLCSNYYEQGPGLGVLKIESKTTSVTGCVPN